MGRLRIDLHTHSTSSDGTDSPAELVAAAAAAGVDVMALTDHDTTGGWDAAVAALPAGMSLVRGAEFSCVVPGPDEGHRAARPTAVPPVTAGPVRGGSHAHGLASGNGP